MILPSGAPREWTDERRGVSRVPPEDVDDATATSDEGEGYIEMCRIRTRIRVPRMAKTDTCEIVEIV